ncbi:hypothetical protein [Rhodospira trueperi]|uniref:Uncharacterized protein n=1 Tax=Rhodospira trueperi TaxID=69960 RepID=A0A1G7H353_9PROT|nr:hypothetical protein [Rhodospira trueperi]SDE94579.1 hypothetical protein SAMN05421720_11731 [Rhodospira trueperi]
MTVFPRIGLIVFGCLLGGAIFSTAMAQNIPYRETVTLSVGQSAIIHGARGQCGEAPPDWSAVAARLPMVSVGTFSDGGVGERRSRRCNGPTPARAVRFTATTPGQEQIELFGDTVDITVTE